MKGCVADFGAFLRDNLDYCGVQCLGGVDWSGAAFDVVDFGVWFCDYECPLELAHVGGVDSEVGL